MTDKHEPLRGEAAWKAARQTVSDRNDAAHKRARAQQATDQAKAEQRRLQALRKENAELPKQPTQ